MANPIGTTLQDRYKVQSFLGDGSHGEVYRAIDQQLQRPVAIKRLRYPAGVAPHIQARFQQEALVLAALDHPHIIEVYDVFETDGWLHLIMAYAAAGSLADFARKHGRLSVAQAIEIGKSVAGALKKAHAQGIVHRDVKPSNILLSPAGDGFVVKLADFGIAHVPRSDDRLTRVGDVLGTPPFWAPEQINGQALTKSDVYALAVTMFGVLAGHHYLDLSDVDEMERRRRILQDRPRSLRRFRTDVPVWLESLLNEALEKDPAARPNAAEFYELLCSEGASRKAPAGSGEFSGVKPFGLGSKVTAVQLIAASVVSALMAVVLALAYVNASAAREGAPSLEELVEAVGRPLEQPVEQAPAVISSTQSLTGTASGISSTLSTPLTASLPLTPEAAISATETLSGPVVIPISPTTVIVTGTYPLAGLRLRYGPSLDAPVKDVLPDGSLLTLMEVLLDGRWARVDTNTGVGQGWVSTDFLYDPKLGKYLSALSGN